MINRGVGVVAGAGWAARRRRRRGRWRRTVKLDGSKVEVEATMPTFAYSGRTRAGQTVSGERVADTMDAAVAALRREQILVTRITPAKAKATRGEGQGRQVGKIGKKVAAKNLAVFTRQFSVMIDAGLPLVQCLDILGTQEEDKNFAAVILQTRTSTSSRAPRSPTRCASTRRPSIRCSRT